MIDPSPLGFQRPCTTLDLKKAPQPKASQCVSRVKSFLERSRSRSVASAAPFPLVSLTRISGQGQGGMRGDAIGTERSEGDERSRVCKLTLHIHH